jgi:hypothetical protein
MLLNGSYIQAKTPSPVKKEAPSVLANCSGRGIQWVYVPPAGLLDFLNRKQRKQSNPCAVANDLGCCGSQGVFDKEENL